MSAPPRIPPVPLRVLLVEDHPADADLVLRHLVGEGYAPRSRRVDTEAGLEAALAEGGWDIALADFQLPGFDGMGVLRILARAAPDLPCIIVSGRISEATAVEALRAGACDCVAKDRLNRLGPAVARELRERDSRIRESRARQQAEETLRRKSELFNLLADHMVDLMAVLDGQGRRIYTSPSHQAVLGHSEAELAGIARLGLVHPEDLEKVEAALAGIGGSGAARTVEHRLRHRNGEWLTFETTLSRVEAGPAGPVRILAVGRDITERKRRERERQLIEVRLRQAQKLESIGQLAAGIAHEINTPTQYLGDNIAFLGDEYLGLVGLLLSQRELMHRLAAGAATPGDAREALARFEGVNLDYLAEEVPKAICQSHEGVARISKIVNAMKEFSHPGGEAKVPTDLNRAIENTLTVSRNEWKYVAELETDLAPDLPEVPCFTSEVNQAVLNLVVNAAHAIEDTLKGRPGGGKGRIRITTRRFGAEAEITVADTGGGIPAAIRERIFDPFFTTKPVGRGTGQGLAIVHTVIVENHQGRVTFESEPGQGTTFHLFLPLE
jgi:PAS domain S-box-containing protein